MYPEKLTSSSSKKMLSSIWKTKIQPSLLDLIAHWHLIPFQDSNPTFVPFLENFLFLFESSAWRFCISLKKSPMWHCLNLCVEFRSLVLCFSGIKNGLKHRKKIRKEGASVNFIPFEIYAIRVPFLIYSSYRCCIKLLDLGLDLYWFNNWCLKVI